LLAQAYITQTYGDAVGGMDLQQQLSHPGSPRVRCRSGLRM
jgi:hypothetical protein